MRPKRNIDTHGTTETTELPDLRPIRVGPRGVTQLEALTKNPPAPTPELIRLMKGEFTG